MITPWKEPFISLAIRTTRVALLAILGLAISSAASAQRSFGHASPSAPLAHVATGHVGAPPVVTRLPVTPVAPRIMIPRATSATSTQTIQSSSLFNSAGAEELVGSQTSLGQLLNPVPGLGFDYPNLAAINHDLGVRAIIDPITQQELALSERLLQLTPTAPISSSFFASAPVVMLEQQPPQVVIVQQPQPPAEQATSEEGSASTAVPAAVEQLPLPDVGQFVLVLRDGTQIQAVAFTRQNDRIVYITTDGRRKSIAIGDLDTAATRRLNDERGTPLQLSF